MNEGIQDLQSWLVFGDGGSASISLSRKPVNSKSTSTQGGSNALLGDLQTYGGLLSEFRRSESENCWRNAQYVAEIILELLDNGRVILSGESFSAYRIGSPISVLEVESHVDCGDSTVATLESTAEAVAANKVQVTTSMIVETLRGEVVWLYPLLQQAQTRQQMAREQLALYWFWQRFRCLYHATTSPRLLDEIDEAVGFELQLWRIGCTEAATPVINALAGCIGEEDEAAGFGTSDDSSDSGESGQAEQELPGKETAYSALVTGVDCLGDLLELQALPWVALLGWLRLLVIVRLNRLGDALAYLEILQWRLEGGKAALPSCNLFPRLHLMCRAMKLKLLLAAGLPRNDLVEEILALSDTAFAENTGCPSTTVTMRPGMSLIFGILEAVLHVGLLSPAEEKAVMVVSLSDRAQTSLAANASLDEGRVAEAGAVAGDLMKLSPPQWREVAVWLECLSLSGENNRNILEQAANSLSKNWPGRAEGYFAKMLCLPLVAASFDEAVKTLAQCLEDHTLLMAAPAENRGSLSNWLHLKVILLVWLHAWQWYFGDVSDAAATAKALLFQFPHSIWSQIVQAQHRILGVFNENRSPDDFLVADEAIFAGADFSTPPPLGGALSAAASPATAGFAMASCASVGKRTPALCEIIGDVGVFAGRLDVAVSYYRDAVQRSSNNGCSCMDRFQLPLRHMLAEAQLPELHLFGVRRAVVAVKLLHVAQDLQLQRAVRLARGVLQRGISTEAKTTLLRIAATNSTTSMAPVAAVWFGLSNKTVLPASMIHYINSMSATVRDLFDREAENANA